MTKRRFLRGACPTKPFPSPGRLCRNVIPESRGILNLQVVYNKRFLALFEMTNTA